ncbi:MAG: DEAD/DEAH box helicase [Desulfobacterales bacterium]
MKRSYSVRIGKKQHKKDTFLKLKPGAEPRLKKVFATIGVPEKRPFIPDPFQLKSLSAIDRGDCLVTAPTGSGKTWIAEQVIKKIIEKEGQAWYASPLKALSNSKHEEFSKIFGPENVGILTGDRKENVEAPIIVGTTEILRNQLYDAMYHGEMLATDFVVLDEAHFLGDEDRGVVWEEIMIYLPARIPILMLSATIGNARQIANWLSSIRGRKCIVIEEKKRPVPLFPLFLNPSGTLFPLLSHQSGVQKKRLSKKVAAYAYGKRPALLAPPNKLPPFGQILRILKKYNLLPAIFFLKSRADCDNAIEICRDNIGSSNSRQELLYRRIRELSEGSPHILNHRQIGNLEQLALAAHHSGQLPNWKLLIETLMNEGLLDAVFATSTVAAGVNFPARTVVFLNSDRFNGREFLPLTPTEFHQMTGRAGRRGKDHIGFLLAIPGKFMDIPMVAKLINAPPSPIFSQIKTTFSMVLNLLLSHSPTQIEDLLEKSFASYLISKEKKKKVSNRRFDQNKSFLRQSFRNHLDFLMETGYVTENGKLTDDGKWASQLRIDQPLLIAEGFKLGLFPENDPARLAAMITLFVNEREADDRFRKTQLPSKFTGDFFRVKNGLTPFAALMYERGFDVRPLFMRPALTIFEWASGKTWEQVLETSELAEGDLAMLVLRTADNLRHIRSLKEVFPKASENAGKAIELILRDPVIAYYGTDI